VSDCVASAVTLWPERDTVPGGVQDELRICLSVPLGDVEGGPLADEDKGPGGGSGHTR
jgi:hypothetical protein